MPRKDPITGCEVLTIFDMAKLEADGEGKTPSQVMSEFFEDFDDGVKEDELRTDRDLLQTVADELREWIENGDGDEDDTPIPVTRISATIDSYRQTFGACSWGGALKAVANDGKTYIYKVGFSESYGSFYEPPDREFEIEWEETDVSTNRS